MENINHNHNHEGNSGHCDECSKKDCKEIFMKKCGKGRGMKCGGTSSLYFMGFFGAAVYYIQLADTFWIGVLGFLKAIVWPVLIIYKLMGFLGM
jgi:hypothetical protein